MKDIFEIRDKMVESFKTIKIANGYISDVVDAHVHTTYSPAVIDDSREETYPKYFLMLDSGEFDHGVGGQEKDKAHFALITVVLASQSKSAQGVVEDLIKDVRRWVSMDSTLGNTVNEFDLTRLVTDGGVSDPEGIAIYRLTASWSGFPE